ncbi:dehydrodolichyl diphosphate synthase [Salix suchowensis]|nr:dehydrodolichyl diphosphate synthase [Salix suchowensis]
MLSLRLRRISVCKTLPQNFFQFFSHQKTSDDRPHGFPPLAAKNLNSGVVEEEIGGIEQAMQLPEGLRRESMPRHVAVIMDGNSRWARQRGLLVEEIVNQLAFSVIVIVMQSVMHCHEAGLRSMKEFIKLCLQWGIKVVTVFAFSIDNWTRPKEEVDIVMTLIENLLKSGMDDFIREGTRVSIIGDSSRVPESLQRTICEIQEMTRENSKFHFIMAISYSGTYDLVEACKSVAQKVRDGVIQVEEINESVVQHELETKCSEFPCPDLLIRTSGELRTSNFLLWQSAYSELFFAKALWPDFGKNDFVEALASYQQRQRRYGSRYA